MSQVQLSNSRSDKAENEPAKVPATVNPRKLFNKKSSQLDDSSHYAS